MGIFGRVEPRPAAQCAGRDRGYRISRSTAKRQARRGSRQYCSLKPHRPRVGGFMTDSYRDAQ